VRKLGAGLLALIVLVLAIFAIGELNETDEDADEPARTTTEALPSPSPGTETGATPEPEPGPDPAPDGSGDQAAIERAVFAYLERAERGEVGPPGLPTTDEASVERIFIVGRRARVRVTGGARLELALRGRRWVVTRAVPAQVEPQPPSGPP